jgi:hypothetical protein
VSDAGSRKARAEVSAIENHGSQIRAINLSEAADHHGIAHFNPAHTNELYRRATIERRLPDRRLIRILEVVVTARQIQETKDGTPIYDLNMTVGMISDGRVTREKTRFDKAEQEIRIAAPGKPDAVLLDPDHD